MSDKLLGWLGWAGSDALGRLLLLTLSTTVFSRILSPRDFGVVAVVFVAVTIASVLVGAPFEEALAQRRDLSRQHAQTAVATALVVGVSLFLLSFPIASMIAQFYQEPLILRLMPVATASILFTGYSDILTGLARRQRKFNDIAIASLGGHAIGIPISVCLALAGFGIWSLIAQRLLITGAIVWILSRRLGLRVTPAFSLPHFKQLSRYASVALGDRLADNLNYFAFNNLVGAIYGLTALGYVNMAMRLIEPIRGAVAGTGHNLAFFYFASVKSDRSLLHARADQLLTRAAFVIAPIFVGVAAIMPVLLPLVAGPGWEPSIGIAMCLGVGAAILLPSRLVYTALSASARPEFSLGSNLANVVVTNAVLVLASGLGPINVGLARIAGDSTQAAIAVGLSPRHLNWLRADRINALLPAWLLSALMGIVVFAFEGMVPGLNRVLVLVLAVGIGVAVYVLAFGAVARSHFNDLRKLVDRRSPTTKTIAPLAG